LIICHSWLKNIPAALELSYTYKVPLDELTYKTSSGFSLLNLQEAFVALGYVADTDCGNIEINSETTDLTAFEVLNKLRLDVTN